MLVRFRVENFRSFRDELELNMLATDEDRHPNHVWICPITGTRLLRAAAIYGPNAGGKSNLVMAIGLFLFAISKSEIDMTNHRYRNFFKPSGIDNPITMEVLVLFEGKFYYYGMSFLNGRVTNEWLSIADDLENEPELIFVRENEREFVFGNRFNRENLEIVAEGTYNAKNSRLFLVKISESDRDELKLFRNFVNHLQGIWLAFPDSTFLDQSLEVIIKEGGAHFVSQKLLRFGINITNFGIKEEKLEKDKIPLDLQVLLKFSPTHTYIDGNRVIKDTGTEVTIYKFATQHGNRETIFDLFSEESDGTKKLIEYIPILENLYYPTVIVDELDRSLHTKLSYQLVMDFLKDRKENQLIFTTHDTNLITLDLLRQDEIFFIQKDETGNSYIYSLSDFRPDEVQKVEDAEQLEKAYLLGRFGAIPKFKQEKN